MANKTLTVQTVWKYTDEDGQAQSKSTLVTTPYQAFLAGALDVPAATADETDFVIPFGSIAEATALYLKNNTDVDLELQLNGSADLNNLPAGGEMHIANPAKVVGAPLTAAKLTAAAVTTLAGTIAFKVFGDPTP